MRSAVTWFEIPSVDFERAVRFYSNVLQIDMHRELFVGVPHGLFAFDADAPGGAIISNPAIRPSTDGPIVYLHVTDLEAAVGRVEAAGGQIMLPITSIGDPGRIALIRDSEGNRVGFHQPSEA